MQLIGLARLGRDAELKTTASGQTVLNFALAYNYGKDKATQWVECAMFGDRAAKVAPYFLKGTAIVAYLDNVHVETYEKRDGTAGVKLTAMLASFEFAGGRQDSAARDDAPRAERSSVTSQLSAQNQAAPKLPGGVQDMNDDLPFDNPYKGRRSYVV